MRFTDIRDSIVSIMKQNLENQQSGKATDASVLNPFVVGEPGIGKTCCVHDAKKILGDDWGIFPYRLAEQEPTILGGMNIPNKEGTRVVKAEPDWHHEIWKLKAQGFDKGIFFLDEVAEADSMVVNVARQLVLGLSLCRCRPRRYLRSWCSVWLGFQSCFLSQSKRRRVLLQERSLSRLQQQP